MEMRPPQPPPAVAGYGRDRRMSKKGPGYFGNPDLRKQVQLSTPPGAEIESQFYRWLSPDGFKPLKYGEGKEPQKLRDRLLTLPVMMAVVVSLVYRRIAGGRELQRILAQFGLMYLGVGAANGV